MKTYSRQLKSVVKNKKQYTLNKDLAIDLGRELQIPPIQFIHPKRWETFIRAWPELVTIPTKEST